MNYSLTIPNSLRKSAALLAMVTLLATSLPIGVLTAFADSTNITQLSFTSEPSSAIEVGEKAHFEIQLQNAGGTEEHLSTSTDLVLSDGDEGGIFYGGALGGSCSSELTGGTTSMNNGTANKAFCYSNDIAGTYNIEAEVDTGSSTVSNTVSITISEAPSVENESTGGTEYSTLQEAVDAASAGDVLVVKGAHQITSTVDINIPLTIEGEEGVIETSGNSYVLDVKSGGAGTTIQDLEFITTTDSGEQNLIYVGADNVTVEGNAFSGEFNALSDSETTRALEIANGISGLLIEDNTFSHLRQPAYVNNASGQITNNYTEFTKGWVVVSEATIEFTGNTWGEGSNRNYYDIAIIKNNPEGSNEYPDIVTISENNNDAVIENQHSSYSSPVLSIVYVDANASGGNGSPTEPYEDTDPAFNRVADGGTIYIASGEYELEQIIVTKDVTVIGDDRETVIIKPAENSSPTASSDESAWILVNSAVEFNLSGVTLDGDEPSTKITRAITTYGTGTIQDNIIKNVKSSKYIGFGVTIFGDSEVADNTFGNIARVGVHVRKAYVGEAIGTATISGNTFIGKGEGDWVEYGVEIGASSYALVEGNSFTNYRGVADSDGSESAGVLVTDYYGVGTVADIEENTLDSNSYGIAVGYGAGDMTTANIHTNNITNSAQAGILATSSTNVYAAENWWGTKEGPDATTVGGVDEYEPWLCGPFEEDPAVSSNGVCLSPATGEIVSPTGDTSVSDILSLEASYEDNNADDNEEDTVNWAIYATSCTHTGTNRVAGDATGSEFTFDGETFTSDFDTTTVTDGEYCFVFNPVENNNETPVRETQMFTIDNTDPEEGDPTTTIVAPTGTVGSTFTVSGVAQDDEALNRVYVQLVNRDDNKRYGGNTVHLIGEGTDAEWSVDYDADADGLPDGVYAAHVTVVDMEGNTGSAGWTENFTVDTSESDTEAPQAVDGLTVAFDGGEPMQCSEEGNVIYTSSQNITIAWDASESEDISHYFFGTKTNPKHRNVGLDTSYTGTITPGNNPYYYSVIAVDESGNESEISRTCEVILDQEAPTTPAPLFPANGGDLNSSELYIDWGESTDDVTEQSNIVYEYQLYLENPDTNPGATIRYSKEYTGTTRHPESGFASGTPEDTYFWRVQACDESGLCSDWSDVREFTIDDSEEGGGTEPEASLVITNPATNGQVLGTETNTFNAEYNDYDDVEDEVFWAIRAGSCSGEDVVGNTPASPSPFHPSSYNPETGEFSVTVNMGNWDEDGYCFVVNPRESSGPDVRATRTFSLETSKEFTTSTTTQIVSGDTATAENEPGWLFNRDADTQSPYQFVLGTSTIGTGSLFINPITNSINGDDDKFIAELFLLSPIAELDSLSYDFNIAAVDASDENEFYMNVYANFGTSSPDKYYDCKYDVVPTVGVVDGWTTVTFDPTKDYPVDTRGSSPFICPDSPADMNNLDATSTIRAVALNVGDTSGNDQGVSGYFDNVVVIQTTDLDTQTTIYDFEPATSPEVVVNNDSNNDGDNDGGGGGSSPNRRVAGASTSSNSEVYDLLENIKDRLAEFLLASYVAEQSQAGQTYPQPASGAVLGDSIAQADAQLPQEDEVTVDEEEDTDEAVDESGEDNEIMDEVAAISWTNYYWILVLLWLLSTAGALWRKNNYPQTVAMKAVQAVSIVVAMILLAGSLFFALVGAFWPALIVTIGAITTYFWSID